MEGEGAAATGRLGPKRVPGNMRLPEAEMDETEIDRGVARMFNLVYQKCTRAAPPRGMLGCTIALGDRITVVLERQHMTPSALVILWGLGMIVVDRVVSVRKVFELRLVFIGKILFLIVFVRFFVRKRFWLVRLILMFPDPSFPGVELPPVGALVEVANTRERFVFVAVGQAIEEAHGPRRLHDLELRVVVVPRRGLVGEEGKKLGLAT